MKNVVIRFNKKIFICFLFFLFGCAVNQTRLNEMFVEASRKGNLEEVKKLLNKGADIEAKLKHGCFFNNALNWAVSNNHFDVVKYLVEHGADVNTEKNLNNYTPLMNAAHNGRFDIVKYLISKGADINARLNDNTCALIVVLDRDVYKKNSKIVRYLVEHGAKVNVMNIDNKTPLNLAVKWGNIEIVNYLLGHGADVNFEPDRSIANSLILAARNGDLNIVKILVSRGARVNFIDSSGQTALMNASRNGHLNVVKYLISKGANINAKSDWGRSALGEALENNRAETAQYLRSLGARTFKRTIP